MFRDRSEAGKRLAESLSILKGATDSLICGIARGGVVVAASMAAELGIPFAALAVKKLSIPTNPELAFGALTHHNIREIDWGLALRQGIEQSYLDTTIEAARTIVATREKDYHTMDDLMDPAYRRFVIVDDGIATGATVLAAIKLIQSLWKKGKKGVLMVATPVAPFSVASRIEKEVDQCIVLETPESFQSVSLYYESFGQVSDGDVIHVLAKGHL